MRKVITTLLLFISTLLTLKVQGQELPAGNYTTGNPKCFVFAGSHFTIGANYFFSFRSYSCTGGSSGYGKYELQGEEYIFSYSPKDTFIDVPSSFQIHNDLNSNSDYLKILVEDPEKELLIGVQIDILNEKNEIICITMTDFDGLAIINKEVKSKLNLIRISYVGFNTLEIPAEEVNGNVITVKLELGKPLETLVREIHDIQLRVKKSDQGVLVKWPYDEKFREWFHSDKWKDEDCYR